MIKYIILLVLIAVIIFALKKIVDNKKSKNNYADNGGNNRNEYFNKINSMSYSQLDKMHEELLVLVNEIPFPFMPGLDESQNRILKEKHYSKIKEALPVEKQIYGCKTYGEAQVLNQAIVKRLDYLYDNGEYTS